MKKIVFFSFCSLSSHTFSFVCAQAALLLYYHRCVIEVTLVYLMQLLMSFN